MSNEDNILKIDMDELTLGMIETIEEVSGQPIGWLGKDDKPQGKMMVAVAFAIGRQSDPKYTMEQARQMRVDTSGAEDPKSEGDGEASETPLDETD